MQTALILGASGKLGRELTGILMRKGWRVIAVDKEESPYRGWANFSLLQCTTENRPLIENVIRGSKVNVVIHLAFSLGNDLQELDKKAVKASETLDKWLYQTAAQGEVEELVLLSAANASEKIPLLKRKGEGLYGYMKHKSEAAMENACKKTIVKNLVVRVTDSYLRLFTHPLAVKISEELLVSNLPSRTLLYL